MKLNALLLAATAAISFGISAVEAAPIVRDHRTADAANCPGGTMVNGKCAKTVLRPRCTWYCHPRHPH